jgi:3-hydroxyacyl-[acyl-carrier-protein] dehydratase
MRWLWLDRFLKFDSGKSARAIKNLSLAEDVFADHFPGYPVLPACFLLEGLAQTGGILVGEANDFKEKVVLAKVTSARFHREAVAGERILYDVELLTLRPEGASIAGKVYALGPGGTSEEPAGAPLAEAEIFFAHLDQSRSQQLFGEHNFVFGSNLRQMVEQLKRVSRP